MVVAVAAAGVGGRTGFGVAGASGGPHLGQPQVFEELRVLADEVVGVCDVFVAGHSMRSPSVLVAAKSRVATFMVVWPFRTRGT